MAPKEFVLGLLLLYRAFTSLTFAQYSEEDWEERDRWMNVPQLFRLLQIESGYIVGDVGCHEGYLSFHLSERVGPSGKVYAVDVNERRIESLKQHAKDRKVSNIVPVLGAYDNPKLPKNTMDAVFLVDTYHEIEKYTSVLSHIKASLKPDGKLLVLEKLKAHKRDGSRKVQAEAHTLSAKYVKKELEAEGFSIIQYIQDFGNWKNETDKQMWILVAVYKKK